ncbi:MAG TPA: 50S ribosomal protein L29 [Clostridiales bacterium]|nr:50S ribosomal protein L29 [Clostridiales bacterium]
MKPAELRELGSDELEAKLRALREELFNLRFQLAVRQLDNPMRVRRVRKDIARVMTIQRERQLNLRDSK